jgi:predicted DNA-binding protein (MmcQ/YjbR family)
VAKPIRSLSTDAHAALAQLRSICAALDHVEEALSFGNPAFKHRGKAFAVLDLYEGQDCLWLRVGLAERDDLLKIPGWFKAPYDPKGQALCCSLDRLDWRLLEPLIASSHHSVKPAGKIRAS